MFTPLARVAPSILPLLVLFLTVTPGSGQPSPPPGDQLSENELFWGSPFYTAFPEIIRPLRFVPVKEPNGVTIREPVIPDSPFALLPPLPVLPADASLLQQVRLAQFREGRICLAIWNIVFRIGSSSVLIRSHRGYTKLMPEVYGAGAELEETPARRVRWHEVGVRESKENEWWIMIRVRSGTDPPQYLDTASFRRLRAEAELLELLAAVKQSGEVPVPDAPAAAARGCCPIGQHRVR